jgi:hypothetical protein
MPPKTVIARRRPDLDAMYNEPPHQTGRISTFNEKRSDLQNYSLPVTGQRIKVVERQFFIDTNNQDYQPTRMDRSIIGRPTKDTNGIRAKKRVLALFKGKR